MKMQNFEGLMCSQSARAAARQTAEGSPQGKTPGPARVN